LLNRGTFLTVADRDVPLLGDNSYRIVVFRNLKFRLLLRHWSNNEIPDFRTHPGRSGDNHVPSAEFDRIALQLQEEFGNTRIEFPPDVMFATESLCVSTESPENSARVPGAPLRFTCTFPLACNMAAGTLGSSAVKEGTERAHTNKLLNS
jgi:hypothetical protein